MITKFKIFLITLLFVQCSKSQQDVEFELLNNELFFAPIFSNEKGGVELLYEDYLTEKDKQKSKNIIRYKIKNNLPYKILFIPNYEEMLLLTKKESIDYDNFGLAYTILNQNGNDLENFVSLINKGLSQEKVENFKKDSIEFEQDTIRYKDMYERERLKDFTYIEPNKTKIFELELNLPIVNESVETTLVGSHVIPLYKEEEYKFQLHYTQQRDEMEKELPKQILDYLNANNIKIINLSFHSDIIKLNAR